MQFSPIPPNVFDFIDYDPITGQLTRKMRGRGIRVGERAGGLNRDGYVKVRACGKIFLAHRLAWFWKVREQFNCEIDHINGDRADNRLENLRPADHAQNSWNTRSRNQYPKGVSWDKAAGRFRARIKARGRPIFLGNFITVKAASEAYAAAAQKYHGDFARTG